jgi:protein TonB
MRLASFTIASIALHAGALTLLPNLEHASVPSLVPVTVVSVSDTSGTPSNHIGSPLGNGATAREKSTPDQPRVNDSRTEPALRGEVFDLASQDTAVGADNGVALAAAEISNKSFSDTLVTARTNSGFDGGGIGAGHSGESGGGGNGAGGSASGAESKMGYGTGGSEARRIPISLRYAPMPQYPERARQNGGKEGKVTLRVVVDSEGRSKTIEILSSSGNDILDQVARESVSKWHFSPARYGDRPIEGWVDVPIEFRLSDARN